jgi:formylmethanofuran dehydrogenase subunit E
MSVVQLPELIFSSGKSTHVPPEDILGDLMDASSVRHQHLCPRQVLGIRIGLLGLRELGFIGGDYRPRFQNGPRFTNGSRFRNGPKQLLTIVETDGCGADGIAVATDCYVGRRSLRVLDFGKLAATLVDTHTGRAVRVAPRQDVRQRVQTYALTAPSRWHAYLQGYQAMPDQELLQVQDVRLAQPSATILSRPNARVLCARCGEEIMNERQVRLGNSVLCRPCAGERYYLQLQPECTVSSLAEASDRDQCCAPVGLPNPVP